MKHRNLTLWFIAAFAVFRILYVIYTPFDISPDEAHYWEWSRRLDLSYYSKGPGVAYAIAFFSSIFGPTGIGIRIGAVIVSSISSYLVFLLGKEIFNEKAGFYGALLTNISPIFAIGSVLMTTDVLFLFFWISSVYFLNRALEGKNSLWWYMAGVSIGLGFLCKYTMVLIYPSLLLMLIFSKKERVWLLDIRPYIMGLISLAAATSVIYWNIAHGQVTIKHTMGQAHLGSGTMSLWPFFEFLGAQAGLMSPLIFIALVYGVARCAISGFREKRSALLLLFFTGAPLFLFFLFKSLHGKVQANWAIASYVTAFPAAAWSFEGLYSGLKGGGKGALKALAWVGIILGATATFFVYFPWMLGSTGYKLISGPPYNRVTGWKELGGVVSKVKEEMDKLGPNFIASDTYQITSELALYVKGNPVTYNFDTGGRRMNQYDLWPGYETLSGFNAIYVRGGNEQAQEKIKASFDRCDREVTTLHWYGNPLKEFTIFRCYNFKGMDKGTYKTY
ncbi:MAG: glycosyltransferase family 39 protein [Deltaproteobacteria bacterium]|nr:glycosyltransferase family 39 protein [Deltaproteobacteria bacterium]